MNFIIDLVISVTLWKSIQSTTCNVILPNVWVVQEPAEIALCHRPAAVPEIFLFLKVIFSLTLHLHNFNTSYILGSAHGQIFNSCQISLNLPLCTWVQDLPEFLQYHTYFQTDLLFFILVLHTTQKWYSTLTES